MSHYTGARKNEIFLGNVEVAHWPKEYLASLKTARLGEQALDIKGEKIDPAEMRPLFIDRSEADAYDRIMMRRTFPNDRRWS